MSKILPLGAINKKTREYVYPKVANKKDEYVCPDCNKDLTLCKGDIIIPYFRHKIDSINPCQHYSNPTESQIHKDAKILLKNLLEKKVPISFTRECCSCKKMEEFEIPEITETSTIRMEYGFQYNGSLQIADVAYLDNDEIFTLFEIFYTHKTCSEKRPEPWFEIDAEKLIRLANDDSLTTLQIPCIRCEKCDECTERENIIMLNKKKAAEKLLSWDITDMKDTTNGRPFYCSDYDFTIDFVNKSCSYYEDEEEEEIVGDFLNRDMEKELKPDILIHNKANPRYYIYLNKPTFTSIQVQELIGYCIDVYFIDVDWILQQKTQPDKLKCDVIVNDIIRYNPKQKVEKKNTRYLIRELNTYENTYLNIDFSKKDFIKKLGGKWDKTHKLWYVTHNKYKKNKSLLEQYKIYWSCKDCEDIKKQGLHLGDSICDICLEEELTELGVLNYK